MLQVSISQYFPLLIQAHNTEGIQNRDVERQAKMQLICLAVNFQQSKTLKCSICLKTNQN